MAITKLSKRLREERKRKGLSQQKLAIKVGISLPTLSHIEHGSVFKIDVLTLYNFSKALDLDFMELVDLVVEEN